MKLKTNEQVGTGAILAAEMRGRATSPWVQPAVASMLQSNGPAAGVLRDHGARACTDVTGFGVAGHLAEMLRAAPLRRPPTAAEAARPSSSSAAAAEVSGGTGGHEGAVVRSTYTPVQVQTTEGGNETARSCYTVSMMMHVLCV